MVYALDDILRDVRVAINENDRHGCLVLDDDQDTLTLDEIIRSKVEEGVRDIVGAAPFDMLDGGSPIGQSIYWREDGSGQIILPDDYLRLMVFRMSDWERPVFIPVMAGDPKYNLQFSRRKGLRGTPQKPVVCITRRPNGLILEFFSSKSKDAKVAEGLYLSLPEIKGTSINIPQRCYRAVIYKIAGLSALSAGQSDMANAMLQVSNGIMNLKDE